MPTLSGKSLAALLLVCSWTAAANAGEEALYSGVAGAIKGSFTKSTDQVAGLKRHFEVLRLADHDGNFLVKELNGKGLTDPFDPAKFVDQSVRCAAQSPYLNEVMRSLGGKSFGFLHKPERSEVLVDATLYAVALDRLTRLMRNDHRVLRAVQTRFLQVKGDPVFKERALKVSSIFGTAKRATIDFVILQLLEVLDKGKVDATFLRELLPLNIAEAALADLKAGNKDNAHVGAVLMRHRPGIKSMDSKSHNGPTRFTSDKQALLISPPLPKEWADLYSVWNLDFITGYENWPYFFAKLLNPQVLCYAGQPDLYLYNRALALYLHIQWEVFRRVDAIDPKWQADHKKTGTPDPKVIDWKDHGFTAAFASVNHRSKDDYKSKAKKVQPGLLTRMKEDAEELKELVKELPGDAKDLVALLKE